LFLCKEHKNELDSDFKDKFLAEMSRISEAVYNYELLGNGDPHMHWHIFPSSEQEPNPTHPVWCGHLESKCMLRI
jgi:diadenosine tetraphosphate (Ap4A) HIT family hydrolase